MDKIYLLIIISWVFILIYCFFIIVFGDIYVGEDIFVLEILGMYYSVLCLISYICVFF